MYPYKSKFEYAWPYVLVLPDNSLYFKKDTPPDIKERFEKEWEQHCRDEEERFKNGDFTFRL